MAYRDDFAALRDRLSALEGERTSLRGRQRELEEAAARIADLDAQTDALRDQIDDAGRIHLRVASPCTEDWGQMRGDERVRHCLKCDKNVYNVVEMTRAEVHAVIERHEGNACMRLYQRKDGTVLTADCPVGVKRKRRRRFAAGVLLSAGAAFGGAALLNERVDVMVGEAGDYQVQIDDDEDVTVMAGGIMAPQPPMPGPSGSTAPVEPPTTDAHPTPKPGKADVE